MRKSGWQLAGLIALLSIQPAICFANPISWAPAEEMLPWIALAEVGIVLLECALVRMWLKLGFMQALTAVFWANAASVGVPYLIGFSSADQFMSEMNSFLMQWSQYSFEPHQYTFWQFLGYTTSMMAFWMIIAIVLELPVMLICLREHEPRYQVTLSAIGMNLISYPLFYSALLAAGWLIHGVQAPDKFWGY